MIEKRWERILNDSSYRKRQLRQHGYAPFLIIFATLITAGSGIIFLLRLQSIVRNTDITLEMIALILAVVFFVLITLLFFTFAIVAEIQFLILAQFLAERTSGNGSDSGEE